MNMFPSVDDDDDVSFFQRVGGVSDDDHKKNWQDMRKVQRLILYFCRDCAKRCRPRPGCWFLYMLG